MAFETFYSNFLHKIDQIHQNVSEILIRSIFRWKTRLILIKQISQEESPQNIYQNSTMADWLMNEFLTYVFWLYKNCEFTHHLALIWNGIFNCKLLNQMSCLTQEGNENSVNAQYLFLWILLVCLTWNFVNEKNNTNSNSFSHRKWTQEIVGYLIAYAICYTSRLLLFAVENTHSNWKKNVSFRFGVNSISFATVFNANVQFRVQWIWEKASKFRSLSNVTLLYGMNRSEFHAQFFCDLKKRSVLIKPFNCYLIYKINPHFYLVLKVVDAAFLDKI